MHDRHAIRVSCCPRRGWSGEVAASDGDELLAFERGYFRTLPELDAAIRARLAGLASTSTLDLAVLADRWGAAVEDAARHAAGA